MLSEISLKQFAAELHTSERNVKREYLQSLLLSYLYQHPRSDALAFKGGTALRLIFGSPRFSEDLDFSSSLSDHSVKLLLGETFEHIRKESFIFSQGESKTTSGGYFARYRIDLHGEAISLEFNISLREGVKPEPILVPSRLIPAYQCLVLPTQKLVGEKIDALFRRKKPRDFFDVYYLLRERRAPEKIITYKERLLDEVSHLDARTIRKELRLLLPTTHQGLLQHFPSLLAAELKRL